MAGTWQSCTGNRLLSQGLELDPQFAAAYGNLARAQHALGLLADAASNFRQALALAPDNAQLLKDLAILQA